MFQSENYNNYLIFWGEKGVGGGNDNNTLWKSLPIKKKYNKLITVFHVLQS